MKLTRVSVLSSAFLMTLALSSCSSSTNSEEVPPPSADGTQSPDAMPASPAATENPQNSLNLKTIYFDFDRYNIRADQKTDAMSMSESLKANPSSRIQVQGNTDDRGSSEYNMALGERRAQSLKNFLVVNGVLKDRIETISYGKEKPAVQGEGEEAWSKNRRADVVSLDK